MFLLAEACGQVKESKGVIKPFLKRWGNILLGGIRGLEGDNMYIDLNSKGKHDFLPILNLGKLEDIIVKGVKADIKLHRT